MSLIIKYFLARYTYTHFLKALKLLRTLTILCLITLCLSIWHTIDNTQSLKRAENALNDAQLIAMSLRDSSDRLTMMARLYVVTGKPRFKHYFYHISDIREGRKPTPDNYQFVYWDFYLPENRPLPEEQGTPQSLMEQIYKLDLTEQEQRKLAQAKNNSVELINTEARAFSLVERDKQSLAIQLLFNNEYLLSKAAIMQPIDEFIALLMQRKTAELNATSIRYELSLIAMFCSVIILIILLILSALAEKLMDKSIISSLNRSVSEKTQALSEKNDQLEISLKELAKANDQLLEFERANITSRLIPGIAHEINTPVGISVTAASTQLASIRQVKEHLSSKKLSAEEMEEFLLEVSDMSEIVYTNMKKISRLIALFKKLSTEQGDNEAMTEIHLKAASDEIIHAVSASFCHDSRITYQNLIDERLFLTVPYTAFSQILTELISNARKHAFSETREGTITLSTFTQNDALLLNITDDGKGMDPQTRGQVFTPFFSTGRVDGHIGLGMNIVYNLIRQKLQGDISCTSSTEGGTTVSVTFNGHWSLKSKHDSTESDIT